MYIELYTYTYDISTFFELDIKTCMNLYVYVNICIYIYIYINYVYQKTNKGFKVAVGPLSCNFSAWQV